MESMRVGGETFRIDNVIVEEWGSYNKEEKYWPIKVKAIGINNAGNKHEWKNMKCQLRKDDYGKWQGMCEFH